MNTQVFAALFLATASAVFAGVPAPGDAPGTGDTAKPAGEFQLKNRSSFAVVKDAHNPFWPLGWTKTVESATSPAAPMAGSLRPENFEVTSILLNDPPMAVVNGKAMAEGELIALVVGNQKIVVQLAAVQDGRIVIRYQNQNIVVPMRRRGEAPLASNTMMR